MVLANGAPSPLTLAVTQDGRQLAGEIYREIEFLPVISPHTHVPVGLFADEESRLGSPADVFVTSDHNVLRTLYSAGVPLEACGLQRLQGDVVVPDARAIWRVFTQHLHLFWQSPTLLWIKDALWHDLEIHVPLTMQSGDEIFDELLAKLASSEFSPRGIFTKFLIETLSTTDDGVADLSVHESIRNGDWAGSIRPTFRPDDLGQIQRPEWRSALLKLGELTSGRVDTYSGFLASLAERRSQFIHAGATAADHGIESPYAERLSEHEAGIIFQRAFAGRADEGDARRFDAHLLMVHAGMSCDDGLVMQLHAGALRDHNGPLASDFGPAIGGDIPVAVDWTRGLASLLSSFGNSSSLTLVLFTLDESTYSRELAPLAGHYPALRLGSPWWFHDSPQGMRRYLDCTVEVAGLHNLTGFVDDARNLLTLAARHRLWRRAISGWLGDQVSFGTTTIDEAVHVARLLSYDLARDSYKLPVGAS